MKTTLNKIILASCVALTTLAGTAQNSTSPVLLTIAGKNVTKAEFENIYKKNSSKDQTADKKSLKEYLDLFINFKLKVKEAEEMGLDTTPSFKNELEGYRKQLAQPYLTDNEVNEKLLREAYDRLKTDVKAAHILVKVDANALPKDTVAAYNKIMQLRSKILKGEDFGKVAKQNSDDPSAKENNGDLGYFTAMQMVYPFENAAYNTKVGEVSMPVRTRFGYHIIKVIDKRAAQGQILAAHIMIKAPKGATKEDSINAKNKIEEIYTKLKAGGDFAELAKQFSDDKGSAKKGGELPLFGTGRMVPEFENAAFALQKDGDYSAPVLTQFGWHIIKRISKKDMATFEEMKPELKTKIQRDSRSQKSKESLIAKIKKEYNFKEFPKTLDEITKVIDTTYFEGKWDITKAKGLNKVVYTIADKNYTQQDFAIFLENRQTKTAKIPARVMIDNMYKQFVEKGCIDYEEGRLPLKFPEFKMLLEEYRDGILLFELTDRKVWSAAVKDTTGLKEYYEKNKQNYLWDDRLDASIFTCANAKVAEEVHKYLNNKKKKYTNDDILKMVNKDSQLNLKIESGNYLKGDNETIDKIEWIPGTTKDTEKDKQIVFVVVNKILAKTPKTLTESKGLVTADYQNYLEKQWIDSLRAKYPVKVDDAVLSTIK